MDGHAEFDELFARAMNSMVMESVVPELNADFSNAAFDMQMFMATRGRKRTLSEWVNLFDQSGLTLEELAGLQSLGKILVRGRRIKTCAVAGLAVMRWARHVDAGLITDNVFLIFTKLGIQILYKKQLKFNLKIVVK